MQMNYIYQFNYFLHYNYNIKSPSHSPLIFLVTIYLQIQSGFQLSYTAPTFALSIRGITVWLVLIYSIKLLMVLYSTVLPCHCVY